MLKITTEIKLIDLGLNTAEYGDHKQEYLIEFTLHGKQFRGKVKED